MEEGGVILGITGVDISYILQWTWVPYQGLSWGLY